jgi:hypothetical protein
MPSGITRRQTPSVHNTQTISLAPLPSSKSPSTPKNPDDLTTAKNRQNVTSGRNGGVEPSEDAEDKSKPILKQGETLSGKVGGGETERAKKNREAININGGQLVDPAYREIGDGGKAANVGELGNEKAEGGKKGRDSKL